MAKFFDLSEVHRYKSGHAGGTRGRGVAGKPEVENGTSCPVIRDFCPGELIPNVLSVINIKNEGEKCATVL